MTKELDWLERQPARTCRGEQNQDLAAVTAKMEREAAKAEAAAERAEGERASQLKAIAARHRRAIGAAGDAERTGAAITAMIQAGSRSEAALLDKMARKRCGADLNPTIFAEVPEDGESHDFACPKCGMRHHATRIPPAALAEA